MTNVDPGKEPESFEPPVQGDIVVAAPTSGIAEAAGAARRRGLQQRLRAAVSFVCQAVALVLLAIVVIAVVAIVTDDPEPSRSASQSASMRSQK